MSVRSEVCMYNATQVNVFLEIRKKYLDNMLLNRLSTYMNDTVRGYITSSNILMIHNSVINSNGIT